MRQYTQGNPQVGQCLAEASCACYHAVGRTGDRPVPIKPFRIMDCASLDFVMMLLKWVLLAVNESSAQQSEDPEDDGDQQKAVLLLTREQGHS